MEQADLRTALRPLVGRNYSEVESELSTMPWGTCYPVIDDMGLLTGSIIDGNDTEPRFFIAGDQAAIIDPDENYWNIDEEQGTAVRRYFRLDENSQILKGFFNTLCDAEAVALHSKALDRHPHQSRHSRITEFVHNVAIDIEKLQTPQQFELWGSGEILADYYYV